MLGPLVNFGNSSSCQKGKRRCFWKVVIMMSEETQSTTAKDQKRPKNGHFKITLRDHFDGVDVQRMV